MQNRSNHRLQKVFIKFTPELESEVAKGKAQKEPRNARSADAQCGRTPPGHSWGRVTQHPGLPARRAGPPRAAGTLPARPPGPRGDSASCPASRGPRSPRPLPPANPPLRPSTAAASGRGGGGSLGFPQRRGVRP